MSYLRKKFALSTNFDRWFTYCVLSQQNSVSVEIALLTFDFFVNIRQNLHNCAKAAKESKLH